MKKTRVNKKILNACGAALALSLIAANVNYYSVEVDASTVSVNGQATTVIPGSLSMKSPAALSTLALPASAFGTLSWANPSTVPSQYSGSYPVVLKVTDTKGADFSKVPGWNAANSTVSGSVTVVVQSLAPATPVPTQAAETPPATPVPTQAPATPAPTEAVQETPAATPTPMQATAETPTATPAPTQAPQTSAEPSAEPTPTQSAEKPATTATPAPTESKAPEATATPAPADTNTPHGAETPSETGTPAEAGAPDGPATPAPSETETSDATATPAPSETETPDATETPTPSVTEKPDVTETPSTTETPTVTEAPELPGAPSMEEKFQEQQGNGEPQYIAYEIYDEDAEAMMEEENVAAPSTQNNTYKIAGSKPLVGGDIANSGYGGSTAKPSATPAVSSSGTTSNRAGTTGSGNTGTSNNSSNRTNSGTTGNNGSNGSSGTNYNTGSARRSQNNSVAMVTTKRYGVLTGDDTEIFPYAATGIFSLIVAAFTFFTMHSRRKVVSTVSEEDDK